MYKITSIMIQPKQTLSNPYYFINNPSGVIYEISNSQDYDNCGVHKVEYKTTETTDTKKGQIYLDHNNTRQVVESDGQHINVSTGEQNDEENFKIFPCIGMTFSDGSHKYLWFQNLIEDGDIFNGTAFQLAHDTKYTKYYEKYKASVDTDIINWTKNGMSLEQIKKKLPEYLTKQNGEEIDIDGETKTISSIKFFFGTNSTTGASDVNTSYTDAKIKELMYTTLQALVKNYVNTLTKKAFNKQLTQTAAKTYGKLEDSMLKDITENSPLIIYAKCFLMDENGLIVDAANEHEMIDADIHDNSSTLIYNNLG